jgi:hypothetical protein
MPTHDGLPCPTTFYTSAKASGWGRPVPTTWGQLRRALLSHNRPRAAEKAAAPCWGPHILRENRRLAVMVEHVTALVLDFDEGLDVDGAMALFPRAERVAYSTFSATAEEPRCRLVLPLAHHVAGPIWSGVIRGILKDIGHGKQAADPKCVDPSRLFLLPCAGPVEVAAYAEGDLTDVSEYVERAEYEAELARLALEHARAAAARRAEAARRWADRAGDDGDRAERRGFAALRSDPVARRQAADDLGAKISPRDGSDVAHGLTCPACGRADAWFVIEPRQAFGAYCNHRNTGGWAGGLGDLLTAAGRPVSAYGVR